MGALVLHSLWLIAADPHRGGSISLRPPLAKGVDIADHGNELAPKDLRMREAALGDTATILGALWAGKTLPLIPNSGRGGQGDGNHGTASE